MGERPAVTFDAVWKKFRRGERHDSLRDMVPTMISRAFRKLNRADLAGEEFWALQDVSFEVGRGEALGVIGPNGAGKSTALKLLTRILRPTRGHCEVRGRVGALIEVAAGFHPDLTGRENVYLQGTIMGMKHGDIERRFDAIVDFAGVAPFIDTQVKRYSSGMQARLGFAIAAHLEPDVLFVDEVLSVGDMSFQSRCTQKMQEQLRAGVTVVFVSHNLQAVAALCHRAVVLAGGRMAFDGPPALATAAYLKASPLSGRGFGALNTFALESVDFQVAGARSSPEGAVIKPHAACRLVATVRCLVDSPPICIGFSIDRTADLLYCYGVSSEELGQPLVAMKAGTTATVTVDFTAHFVRGHYRANLNVRDSRAGVFHLFADSVAMFSVDEEVTYSGVTDVGAVIDLSDSQPPHASAMDLREPSGVL